MNLIKQHRRVVNEIEKYHSFSRRIAWRNAFRALNPRLMLKPIGNNLRAMAHFFRQDGEGIILDIRRKQYGHLCSEPEKANAFYRIVCSDLNPMHALSKHLEKKFPDFEWTALERTSHWRIGLIPSFSSRPILNLATLVLTVIGVFQLYDKDSIVAIDLGNFWGPPVLSLVVYCVIILFAHLWLLVVERRRLQRAKNILGYMAIRVRYE